MGVGRRRVVGAAEGVASCEVNFEAKTSRRLPWSVHRDLSLNSCCRVFLCPGDVARGMSHFWNKELKVGLKFKLYLVINDHHKIFAVLSSLSL